MCHVIHTHVSSHGDAGETDRPQSLALQPAEQHHTLQHQCQSHHKEVGDVVELRAYLPAGLPGSVVRVLQQYGANSMVFQQRESSEIPSSPEILHDRV